ncbi:MAG TPA: ABC transporter permease, partial [Actinomycetota bacterium]|nr:ABC transporter permease [Actinomycetota bacterium]
LVVEKYLAVMAQVGAAVAWVSVVGGVAGAFAFGFGPFPTLSGVTIGNGEAVLRVLAAAAYVLAGVSGIAAIGMFLSTLTVGGLGAAGATLAVAIGSEVLDNLSRLRAVHPFLPTHGWPAFADLFRSPIGWSAIAHGLVLDAAYVAVFLGGALLVFWRKDVTD